MLLQRKRVAKRILANLVPFEFDMYNLIPTKDPIENLEDAASGSQENLPKKTLRDRSYGPQPLMIQPEYRGDFLEQGIMPKIVEGESSENLNDFDMPEEMLKHQEQPYPRDLTDEFYDINKPGPDVGMELFKDYNDRSWDPSDSPEMSEDKLIRMQDTPKMIIQKGPKVLRILSRHMNGGIDPQRVVSAFLLDQIPEIDINLENSRVAMTLNDLSRTQIYSKGGYKDLNYHGVQVFPGRGSNPKIGKWVFRTSSGGPVYTTVFQFIPQGTLRDASRLHVRVSCTCKAWLFWGSQYHASMQGYLQGKLIPKFAPPKKRDPQEKCLVCKHVLAAIQLVKRYKLPELSAEIKKKLQKEPKIRVKKVIPEKLHIPNELLPIGERKKIKDIESRWDTMGDRKRSDLIMRLTDPDEIVYLAHKFPETATGYVARRLLEIQNMPGASPTVKKKAAEYLADLPDAPPEEKAEVVLPPELKKIDSGKIGPGLLKRLPGYSSVERERLINQMSPKVEEQVDLLAYLAYGFNDNPEILEIILNKLKEVAKTKPRAQKWLDETNPRAQKWLKQIF